MTCFHCDLHEQIKSRFGTKSGISPDGLRDAVSDVSRVLGELIGMEVSAELRGSLYNLGGAQIAHAIYLASARHLAALEEEQRKARDAGLKGTPMPNAPTTESKN